MNESNPYQTPKLLPLEEPLTVSLSEFEIAKRQVSRPGSALIIMGSIQAVFDSIPLVYMVFFRGSQLISSAAFSTTDALMYALMFALFFVHVFISVCGAKLAFLESRELAFIGSVLACIPIITPFGWLGIPFGIWSLAVLQRRDVILAFEQVKSRRIGAT